MARTTNAGFDSAAAAGAVGVMYLVELDFLSGTLYYTNWPVDVTVGATTYTGLGNLGSVGQIKESEDGATQTIDLELSQVNTSLLALGLGNVSAYQDRAMRIYLALTDTNFTVSGSPVLLFAGFMDTVRISRNDKTGKVILRCSTGGYDVRRNPAALRLNDAQHQARHPGELLFVYAPDLIGKPARWMSVRLQAALS